MSPAKETLRGIAPPRSASDVRGGRIARIDLRLLEKDEDLDPATSTVIEKRLRSLKYQAPPDVTKASREGHEALAELMRKAGHNSMAYTAKAKRGEGPLDLPIYGIDQITANERTRKATSLLQTEVFRFHGETSALISRTVSYKSKPSVDQNLLICGDNLEVMQRLYDEYGSFLDLVYVDPPFCSSRNYDGSTQYKREGFADRWDGGLKTYLPWLTERLIAIHSLLKAGGNLYLHLDYRAVHYVKVELDKIFGNEIKNEIIWSYTGNQQPKDAFPRKHDTILRYCKRGGDPLFYPQFEPYSEATFRRYNHVDNHGRRYKLNMYGGRMTKSYMKEEGKAVPDVWPIPFVIPTSSEKTGYPTQKPEGLLERVIKAATREGMIVADFFAGSGTALAVAQKLGRRWIGVDQNPQAIEVAADRIRRISRQKDKAVGIEIPDFTVATSRGYSKFYASHYHREDVLTIDDSRKGNSLSEFQEFILDCYLPRDGRKGDATLHGFRTEDGKEIAVFVGPNRRETKQTDVVQFLESVGRKAKTVNKVEILGWSFSPKLLKALDQLVEANGLDIELKRIHVFPLRIEDALRAKNVRFLAAARATVNMERSGASLSCALDLLSPASEVRDIHWFIYPDESADLEKIEYNFIKDDDEASEDDTQDEFEEASTETADLKRHLKSLELKHTFKGIQNGEYRIYVRVTDRRGHPTSIVEDIKVEGKNASSLSASIESSEKEAA